MTEKRDIRDLIEASSLGTPEAKALRESVSDETAQRIVARAEELSGMRNAPCGQARRGVAHKPHVRRSAITQRFVRCPGGPALRWEGDDG